MNSRLENFNTSLQKRLADISYRDLNAIPENQHCVSFTFDDVPSSGFINGQKILDKYGFKGTFYVSGSLVSSEGSTNIGCSDDQPSFSLEDFRECFENDHEIGCHTYSHSRDTLVLPHGKIVDDLERNSTFLNSIVGERAVVSFSYPFGSYNRKMKSIIGKRFSSSRTIKAGLNQGVVDMSAIKAIQLYEGKSSIEEIEYLIDKVKQEGGWAVFYTHDIQSDYSPYGCSEKFFERIVDFCSKKDINVGTVGTFASQLSANA